jgi:dipeptidyl aminopeptidase/acylaminoacyl peptidase
MFAMRKQILATLALLMVACSALAAPAALPTATTAARPTPTAISLALLPTRTVEPYDQYTIDYLRKRTYGGGKIEILNKLAETDLYTSYSIRYPSDGLNIYGFVNVPKGDGPFPVIIPIHGYAAYGGYDVFDITDDFADILAENQYVVVHPGLRNQPPSDSGDNLLRVGMTVDVMNLIALLKDKANLPAELAGANPDLMGLWGYSLGGEVALRVLTLSPDIKATILYSSLSGNTELNSRQLSEVSQDPQFQQDFQVPLELMSQISPMNYYHYIKSAVQIHHGLDDKTAPISWAVETCSFLKSAGVSVQCIYYPGADHVFRRHDFENVLASALDFYRLNLSQ